MKKFKIIRYFCEIVCLAVLVCFPVSIKNSPISGLLVIIGLIFFAMSISAFADILDNLEAGD